jgi:hypothetical protein
LHAYDYIPTARILHRAVARDPLSRALHTVASFAATTLLLFFDSLAFLSFASVILFESTTFSSPSLPTLSGVKTFEATRGAKTVTFLN